jgi:hypothetical protein
MVNSNCDKHQFVSDFCGVDVGEGSRDISPSRGQAQADQLHGKIQYLDPGLDPITRILQARIEAANPGERLKRPNPPLKSSFPAQPAQTA